MKENKMGYMPIRKLVVSMSLPIMISMLVQSLYNIVDSIFIAKISENALTATSIAYSAQMLQIAVAVGTGVGVNALISRKLGEKNYEEANVAATLGLVLSIISSLIFVAWGLFGTKAFVSQFTDNQETLSLGTTYLHICQVYCMGIFLGTLSQRLLQATGRTFSSMMAMICGAIVNLILDPLLIFGLFFFPEMGIAGAAIATVIGQWVAAIVGLILNYVQNKEIHFVFHGFSLKDVKAIYKVGAPTILTQSFGSIMVSLVNGILMSYSSSAVAFFGVYFKLQSFLFMPMNGLGQGSLPIVGYNYGAKKIDRVLETIKTSISIGAVIGIIGTVVFLLLTKPLLMLFSASDTMLSIGLIGLRIISITFVLAATTMIIGYIISGLGNGTINMLSTAIRQIVILIPCIIILGKIGGLNYVWFAFWISEICAFLFSTFQLKKYIAMLKKYDN
jgi:putative MATE family efflux protein